MEGVSNYTNRVMQVVEELAEGIPTPAYQAGIEAGDLILGGGWETYRELGGDGGIVGGASR